VKPPPPNPLKSSPFSQALVGALCPEDNTPVSELISPYLTIRFQPVPHLMALMVLKAASLKKDELDFVF
jgi:hypothetical protein